MGLKDDMEDDLAAVFHDTSEFAEAVTFHPDAGATGFAATVVPGDIDEQFVEVDTGQADSRRSPFEGIRAALRAGIAVIAGAARDPRRGDTIVFASGAYAGTWTIVDVGPDAGGGIRMDCRRETRRQVAGRGVVEAR